MFSAKSNKLGSCGNGYLIHCYCNLPSLYVRIIAAPYPGTKRCYAPKVVIHRLSVCALRALQSFHIG